MLGAGQVVKRQHYVPQFYLRQWANQSGGFYAIKVDRCDPKHLTVLDRESGPAGFCFEKFFYAKRTGEEDEISQSLEHAFANSETAFAKILPQLEKAILANEQLTQRHKGKLAELMVFMWLRGKRHRLNHQHIFNDLNSKLAEQVANLRRAHAKPHFRPDEAAHEHPLPLGEIDNISPLLLLKDMPGFSNLLAHKHWKIFVSRTSRFVTTDSPYLDVPATTGLHGNSFFQRTQTFILSPRVVIRALNPKDHSGKSIIRKDVTSDRPRELGINAFSIFNSLRFGFHGEKGHLDEIREELCGLLQFEGARRGRGPQAPA